MNCVELQNGCLTLGHPNTFIPSNFTTGKLDTEKYIRNMEIAMDTYIARVNHSPCGDGVIHLYKGADSSQLQERRKFLLIFLKVLKKKRSHYN